MDPIEPNTFDFPIYIISLKNKSGRYKYVANQLDNLGLKNYQRWTAINRFKIDPLEMINEGITQNLIDSSKGSAGCTTSHIKLWKHISKNKLGWTLILEDDTHFHSLFKFLFHKYWKNVPKDVKNITFRTLLCSIR